LRKTRKVSIWEVRKTYDEFLFCVWSVHQDTVNSSWKTENKKMRWFGAHRLWKHFKRNERKYFLHNVPFQSMSMTNATWTAQLISCNVQGVITIHLIHEQEHLRIIRHSRDSKKKLDWWDDMRCHQTNESRYAYSEIKYINKITTCFNSRHHLCKCSGDCLR